MQTWKHLLVSMFIGLPTSACVNGRSEEWVDANHDYMMGKTFSVDYLKGRLADRPKLKIRETELHEEFKVRFSDGCLLIYGVLKSNDVIEYWRVDSGPGTCKVTTRRMHLNQ